MNNTKTWTGLSVEESIRMTEIKWRKYVVMVWPTLLGSRTAKEQNRTAVKPLKILTASRKKHEEEASC